MVNCNPEGNFAKSGFSSGLTGLSPFPRKTHMAKEVYLSANCKSTAGGNFPGDGTQGGKTGKVKTAFHRNAVSGDPGGIRTHDPPLRRRLLYPAELLSHNVGRGSRTRTGDPLLPKQVRYQLRYAP